MTRWYLVGYLRVMPALNINFSEVELEAVRTAAQRDDVSLKRFAHEAVLAAASQRRIADIAQSVAAKSAELNERLAR